MRLTATIICKNEEKFIDRCLQSLEGVDEYIIVDTGSQDNTVKIAKKYGKVYHYKWTDDFATARNIACDKVKDGYFISVDADEILETPIPDIRKQLEDMGEFDALNVKLVWDDAHFHTAPRIFKAGLRWIGSCHEYIVCNPKPSDVVIKYENSPTHETDPDRNLRILLTDTDNPRSMFYLAHEYQDRLDYVNCIKWCDEYIKLSTWRYEKADVYLMKSRCLFDTQRGDEARESCLQAILLNPNFKEALRFMAEISWEKEGIVWRKFAEVATNEDVLFIREPVLYSGSYPSNREPIIDIIKNLNPKSILDMGVGTGYYGELIRKALPEVKLDGVEIFPKYKNKLWDNYDNITEGDVRDIELGEYDLYLMVDVIEHMTKEDGLALLDKIKGPVLISTPVDYDQDEVDGNQYQKHLSKWKLDDFKSYEDYSNDLSVIVVLNK